MKSIITTLKAIGTALPRIIAGIVGAGIIACVTYATVAAAGGIWAPTAPLLISLACGLVVGSMCVGLALRSGRKVLAAALALMLLCGEAYTLLNIGERELEAREAKQAPVRAAMVERERLTKAVTSTPRLAAALSAQETVRARSAARIAEASCVKLCHELLTKQQAAADEEVRAARAEAQTTLETANAALAAIPAVAAVSPLAARINVPDWLLDLIRAGLFSISANGLGAFLLAFSSHNERRVSLSDTVQTSFSATKADDVLALFANKMPDNEPEPPKPRKTKKPTNVLSFPNAKHPVIRALETSGRTMSNGELAKAMGVSDSEASKRWQEVSDQLTVGWNGKYRTIGLAKTVKSA